MCGEVSVREPTSTGNGLAEVRIASLPLRLHLPQI